MPTESLAGWGRTPVSVAEVHRTTRTSEIRAMLDGAGPRGVVARGLGRSYGDAALNAGGDVVVTTGLDRILDVDVDAATVRVEAGVSLDALMRATVPLGLWPVVTPGTRQVTVGGAVASDVHGKNHHRDGTFCAHVTSMVLETPGLGRLTVGPDDDAEVFWATAGGMGLTGVVTEVAMRMLPIETSSVLVDTERLDDLDAVLARMVEVDGAHRYSVAWIDSLAQGRHLGRSVLEVGDHAPLDALPAGRRSRVAALAFAPGRAAAAPPLVPGGLLNRASIAAFNEFWWRKAPRSRTGHLIPAGGFFHPLDIVSGWNRIYGPRGFVQYQLVLPDGEERALRRAVEWLSAGRCASFLSVLKRFGPANDGPLSFPTSGWTLALDIPAGTDGLAGVLDRLDDLVVGAGGRVYLTKDARLRPELLERMYPGLPRWRAVRDRLDPQRRLRSDLSRRLPLVEPLVAGVAA